MGYAGGSTDRPTYRAMGDHTECFQVDFDPSTVTYEALLELFWSSHDPTQHAWKMQYASLILAHDEVQLAAARESAATIAGLFGAVATRVEPMADFWLAEGYHQKYHLRQDHDRMRRFHAAYPADSDFVNSTAAARVNGWLGTGR